MKRITIVNGSVVELLSEQEAHMKRQKPMNPYEELSRDEMINRIKQEDTAKTFSGIDSWTESLMRERELKLNQYPLLKLRYLVARFILKLLGYA